MNRKLISLSFVSVFLLSSCNYLSEDGPFFPIYNRYSSYDKMVDHLEILNKNVPEDKLFVFDLSFEENYSINYLIAGLNYYANKTHVPKDVFDGSLCNYLFDREVYYEIKDETSQVMFTMIFQKEVPIVIDELYWTEDGGNSEGTGYSFQSNTKNAEDFHLKSNGQEVLCIKVNEEFISLEQTFRKNIKEQVIQEQKSKTCHFLEGS